MHDDAAEDTIVFSHRLKRLLKKINAHDKEDGMKNRSLLFVIVVSLSMFVLWGCPKKAEVTTTPETPQAEAPMKEEPKADAGAGAAKSEVKEDVKEKAAAAAAGLQPIYFDFDRSFVRDDAKAVMKANAEWLKANPKVKIKIEGNCCQPYYTDQLRQGETGLHGEQ
jgi:outer membrane protein OmpA-like peptidoglycan-associated protein